VEWGCHAQQFATLQLVHLAFLVACLATLIPAWPGAMRPALPDAGVPGDNRDRHHFMSVVSLMVGSLSALVIVALWIPQWVLSPCFG
jgi:hypothetical protein